MVIYLPRGPFLENARHDESALSALRANVPFPVVQINYRLSRDHQFPTPVHDVLAGYDWIKEHLLPKRAISRAGRSSHVGRIGVCGELIGGGLATMLALSECRVGEPGVTGAAVNNPVVDWTSLDPQIPSKLFERMSASPNVDMSKAMVSLRGELFRKPSHYFDPFASPLLFFRSAGIDIPPAPEVPRDDMEHLMMLERDDFHREQLALSAVSVEALDQAEIYTSAKKRKASKRFPSSSSRLRLPPFHITSFKQPPYGAQASELAKLLRQSYLRRTVLGISEKLLEDGDFEELDIDETIAKRARLSEAEKHAILDQYPEMGLWDDSTAGRDRVYQVAKWLRHTLM